MSIRLKRLNGRHADPGALAEALEQPLRDKETAKGAKAAFEQRRAQALQDEAYDSADKLDRDVDRADKQVKSLELQEPKLREQLALAQSEAHRKAFERDDELPTFDPVDIAPLPAELYEHEELQQILRDAISALPVRSREVVLMRYLGELTFAEIGQALGMPENTAKTLFQRA